MSVKKTLKEKASESRWIATLFEDDSARCQRFCAQALGMHLDFSKQAIDDDTWSLLLQWAKESELMASFEALYAGDEVNPSEHLPAMHPLMRSCFFSKATHADVDWLPFMDALERFSDPSYRLPSGQPIKDIIHVGIGGSDLGPVFISDALRAYQTQPYRLHFVASCDDEVLNRICDACDPASTIAIVVSKSFSTLETMHNAKRLKIWFESHLDKKAWSEHSFAVTARPDRAQEWGFSPASIFSFPIGLGGRFSSWSAVSLGVAMTLGVEHFTDLMAGAYAMDQHVKHTQIDQNLAVIWALTDIWNAHFLNMPTSAMLAYDSRLKYLVNYWQQLSMESLGKSVNFEGETVRSGSIVWGGEGPGSQHSFHQLLMQGSHRVALDFIVPVAKTAGTSGSQELLWANALAQAEVMMMGDDHRCVEKKIQGNQPSNMLLLPKLNPYYLGALMSLLEHRVYAQSLLMDVNAFDQWGVERGKNIASALLDARSHDLHPSTQSLLSIIQKMARHS